MELALPASPLLLHRRQPFRMCVCGFFASCSTVGRTRLTQRRRFRNDFIGYCAAFMQSPAKKITWRLSIRKIARQFNETIRLRSGAVVWYSESLEQGESTEGKRNKRSRRPGIDYGHLLSIIQDDWFHELLNGAKSGTFRFVWFVFMVGRQWKSIDSIERYMPMHHCHRFLT